jgi:hypothetical protein
VHRLALAFALLALAVFASPASGDVLIAEAACPSPVAPQLKQLSGCSGVSAHDGRLVWSAYDSTARAFVLMTASRSVVARAPVPARAQPFDADLGEDARGRVVALYSRCAGDPGGPPSGCTVRELGFGAGATEHALLPGVRSDAPLVPSRWGTRVAIARRVARGNREAALCAAAERPRCRALPGGPLGPRSLRRAAGPTTIDVDAHRVAMGWFWQRNDIVRTHAILVETFAATRATTVVQVGAGGAGNAAVHSPALDGRFVYYANGNASCDYQSASNAVGRYDLRRRTLHDVLSPALAGLGVDAGTVYYAACGRIPSGPGAAGSTLIERADPPPFDRPGAPDPAAAAPCPAARTARGWATHTIGRPSFPPFTIGLEGTAAGAALALWPDSGALGLAARPAGGSFGRVRGLPGSPEPLGAGWTASDGHGHVVAAWRASAGTSAAVQATEGTIDGRLARPQTLDSDPAHPDRLGVPLVAMAPDGGAVVIWTEPPPEPTGPGSFPEGKLLASFLAPGADRFGSPIQVTTGPFLTQIAAVAAADGGRVLIVAAGFVQGQHVTAIEATPAGFAAPVDLGVPRGALTQAGAALASDGAATVVWAAGAATQVVTRAPGGAFASIATVSTAGVLAERTLALAARGRRVALAWSERDVRRTIARVMVADGTVGAPLGRAGALTLREGSVAEMSFALGARGAAGLVWRHACARSDGRVLLATRPSRSVRFAEAVVSGRDRTGRAPVVLLGPGARPTVVWVAGRRPLGPAVVRAATPAG